MLLLIMAGADIKADSPMIAAGFVGGLLIESWGTTRVCWSYYTLETSPLFSVPAHGMAAIFFLAHGAFR